MSEPLEGNEQTNNRAELVAVIRALQLDTRPIEVRSDSAYEVDGYHKFLCTWVKSGFAHKDREIKNKDQWQKLHELTSARAADTFKLTKVKGHATAADVSSGSVALVDKFGNDNADALAVAGTCRRLVDWHARQHRKQQLHVTMSLQ